MMITISGHKQHISHSCTDVQSILKCETILFLLSCKWEYDSVLEALFPPPLTTYNGLKAATASILRLIQKIDVYNRLLLLNSALKWKS